MEHDLRQDLILRHIRNAAQGDLRIARRAADSDRCDNIIGGRVGDEVQRRVGDAGPDEIDAAFAEVQGLAERAERATLHLEAAGRLGVGGGATDLDFPASSASSPCPLIRN